MNRNKSTLNLNTKGKDIIKILEITLITLFIDARSICISATRCSFASVWDLTLWFACSAVAAHARQSGVQQE